MQAKYKILTGMRDIFPESSEKWQYLENLLRSWIATYSYGEIRTPLLEETRLFVRSVGKETDIVGKEMYSFTDTSQEQISLRPEGTASTLRAVVENNYLYSGPKKLWYLGPMFRRERPQKGRYRQFYQFGVEALGFAGPDIDAEIILMVYELWQKLGLEKAVALEINTLGTSAERARYKATLVDYFKEHEELLDEDSKRRLTTNPLRILDSKNPALQELCNAAPRLRDFLGEASLAFYEKLKTLLNGLNIPYCENHRLVRGLDYYNHTVFEWTTDALGSQGTVAAGGRYNGLIEELGGRENLGAIGLAMGLERLLLLLETAGHFTLPAGVRFYLITENSDCLIAGLKYATILREQGWVVDTHFGGQKITQQFKKANAAGADFALIVGGGELREGNVTLKDLRGEHGQKTVKSEALLHLIREWVG